MCSSWLHICDDTHPWTEPTVFKIKTWLQPSLGKMKVKSVTLMSKEEICKRRNLLLYLSVHNVFYTHHNQNDIHNINHSLHIPPPKSKHNSYPKQSYLYHENRDLFYKECTALRHRQCRSMSTAQALELCDCTKILIFIKKKMSCLCSCKEKLESITWV